MGFRVCKHFTVLGLLLAISLEPATAGLRKDGVCAATLRLLDRTLVKNKWQTAWVVGSLSLLLLSPEWIPWAESQAQLRKEKRQIMALREYVIESIQRLVEAHQAQLQKSDLSEQARRSIRAEIILLKAIERHNLQGKKNIEIELTKEELRALKETNPAAVMFDVARLAMDTPGVFNIEFPSAIYNAASAEQWADIVVEIAERHFIILGAPPVGRDNVDATFRPLSSSRNTAIAIQELLQRQTLAGKDIHAISILLFSTMPRSPESKPHEAHSLLRLDKVPSSKAITALISLRVFHDVSSRPTVNVQNPQRADWLRRMIEFLQARPQAVARLGWTEDQVRDFETNELFTVIRQTADQMPKTPYPPPSTQTPEAASVAPQ